MPRYVDVEPIEKFITDGLNDQKSPYGWVGVKILAEVHYAPTADVEPVVHAHWIRRLRDHRNDYYDVMEYPYRCSACREKNKEESKRCPECGARMDEEAKQ